MADVATKVLSTVNASFEENLSARQLAARIVDPASVDANDAAVFAFFSEVGERLQRQFIASMGIDAFRARAVAAGFAAKAGYSFPLSA